MGENRRGEGKGEEMGREEDGRKDERIRKGRRDE